MIYVPQWCYGNDFEFRIPCIWRCDNHCSKIMPGAHFTEKSSMEIQIWCEFSFCSYPNCAWVITTKFCTCHDNWAVMACATICSDQIDTNLIITKKKFHQIWITTEKYFVKWSLVLYWSNLNIAHADALARVGTGLSGDTSWFFYQALNTILSNVWLNYYALLTPQTAW